jgi:predicted nucleic acid-binding Zn ribbon protein
MNSRRLSGKCRGARPVASQEVGALPAPWHQDWQAIRADLHDLLKRNFSTVADVGESRAGIV